MSGMAVIGYKLLNKVGNGWSCWKWLEMAGNVWNARIGWKCLEMAGNVWKMLEPAVCCSLTNQTTHLDMLKAGKFKALLTTIPPPPAKHPS